MNAMIQTHLPRCSARWFTRIAICAAVTVPYVATAQGAIAQDASTHSLRAQVMTQEAAPPESPASDEPSPVVPVPDSMLEQRVVNCMATATPDYVEWGHRYTYWLSGVAQFDDAGNMMPISTDHAGDWVVTIANSRFAPLETHTVLPVAATQEVPSFSFPAVSVQEWNAIGQQPTSEHVAILAYDDASHGLYLGIRNTQVEESPRQLFQVIHYLSDDYAMVSEVSACFIGPRPMVLGSIALRA